MGAYISTCSDVNVYLRIWKRNPGDEEGTRHVQIEFNRSGTPNEEIWILLTRHVVDTHRTSDFAALRVELEDDLIPTATVAENQRTLSSKVNTAIKCCPNSAKYSAGHIHKQYSHFGMRATSLRL